MAPRAAPRTGRHGRPAPTAPGQALLQQIGSAVMPICRSGTPRRSAIARCDPFANHRVLRDAARPLERRAEKFGSEVLEEELHAKGERLPHP
jgi:hypothetical protein